MTVRTSYPIDYNEKRLKIGETCRDYVPCIGEASLIVGFTFVFLGYLRLKDKHSTQSFYLQPFRAFFRITDRILCSMFTMSVDPQMYNAIDC